MLLSGELNLSIVSLISGILTKENRDDILGRVSGKSYREAEIAVAVYKPIETGTRDKIKPVSVLEKKSAPGTGSDPDVNNHRKSLNVETDSDKQGAEITPGVETNSAEAAETDKGADEADRYHSTVPKFWK